VFGEQGLAVPVVSARNRRVEVGERPRRVQHSLSREAHHHTYELQPTSSKVRRLAGQARYVGTANSTVSGV
jgi:hypothetical protein